MTTKVRFLCECGYWDQCFRIGLPGEVNTIKDEAEALRLISLGKAEYVDKELSKAEPRKDEELVKAEEPMKEESGKDEELVKAEEPMKEESGKDEELVKDEFEALFEEPKPEPKIKIKLSNKAQPKAPENK